MTQITDLILWIKEKVLAGLRDDPYILADTCIPQVSLFDHLTLTAGLAVALVREQQARGCSASEICDVSIPNEELLSLTRICGLLHDIGKAKMGQTDYHLHVKRGVQWVEDYLRQQGVNEPYFTIIVNAVARHHLWDNPQTRLEKSLCLADSYASAGDRPELAQAGTPDEVTQALCGTEKELFGDVKPVCLLMGDVDAIKSYVYETNALPEIRGGSEILIELEEDVRKSFQEQLAEECLIYCGGGSFLAVVPASEANVWKARVESLYLQRTKLATVTVAVSQPLAYADISRGLSPYDNVSVQSLTGEGIAGDLLFSHFEAVVTNRADRKNFGEFVAQLTGKLQEAKRRKQSAPFYESLPIHQRCQSCGKRAAIKLDEVREPAEWLCGVCLMKRQKGREERREFLRRFRLWAQQEKGVERIGKIPQDLDTLAVGEGRIALLYADGNNMGDLLQRAKSPASYRHISEALATSTQESLFEAIWSVFDQGCLADTGKPLPFEIIALGGDDVVVIVPASAGWTLAVNLLQQFERQDKIHKLEEEFRDEGVHLNMSVGLTIADVKYPMRFLFDLTEGLLKKAKRLAREKQTGTLFHLWLRAPVISEDAWAILEALYTRDRATRHLTARPYTVAQAKRLSTLVKDLSNVPAAQRRALAEALGKGVHVSLNYALYQVARSKEHKERLRTAYEELGKVVDGKGFWFWRSNTNGWQTALLDALELIELEAHKYPTLEAIYE